MAESNYKIEHRGGWEPWHIIHVPTGKSVGKSKTKELAEQSVAHREGRHEKPKEGV